MAPQKMGTVKVPTPTGYSEYPYFWDKDTGQVKVGNEHAGIAKDRKEAFHTADYYATTLQQRKK